MNEKPLLSICIPSYNRPQELIRLLESVDIVDCEKIEIVICEDYAPKRTEVRNAVKEFMKNSKYNIRYVENEVNLGYDRNLRECINQAKGTWIMYMGDDDVFVPEAMNGYIEFIEEHNELGYVLRSSQALHADGSIENFKYYEDTKFFEPGFDAYVQLFRKSVFISGFCFKREYALKNLTDRFDGSLLYQLYILAEICMEYPSAYYGNPITRSIDGGIPYFGTSEAEKDLYTPGTITVDNSVNFIKNFYIITDYMDEKHHINSTDYVKKDMSKYAYPILSIQRKKGAKEFRNYHKQLKQIGIAITPYYYIYYWALLIFNERFCDKMIRGMKKALGRTPKL